MSSNLVESSSQNNVGIIIGVVTAVIVLSIAIGVGIYFLVRRKKNSAHNMLVKVAAGAVDDDNEAANMVPNYEMSHASI